MTPARTTARYDAPSAFERHLIHKHNLPDHWARTFGELFGGKR